MSLQSRAVLDRQTVWASLFHSKQRNRYGRNIDRLDFTIFYKSYKWLVAFYARNPFFISNHIIISFLAHLTALAFGWQRNVFNNRFNIRDSINNSSLLFAREISKFN